MTKKWLVAATIALSSSFIPVYAQAENTAPAAAATNQNVNTATEMSKDNWLNAMKPMLPDLICKGFIQDPALKKRFDELKITYEQCVTFIPESASVCQDKIYANIPDKVTSDSASTWGKALGECIGQDFAQKHLMSQ